MKQIMIIFLVLIQSTRLLYSQELIWKHTQGPMGGIVGDMAINSKGEIYAGVYSFWIDYSGLYKSTNNGERWNKIKTQFDDFEVYAIYITKEDHIWVGTNFQGRIYRSTDDGLTWENKRNGYNTGECWHSAKAKMELYSRGMDNILNYIVRQTMEKTGFYLQTFDRWCLLPIQIILYMPEPTMDYLQQLIMV